MSDLVAFLRARLDEDEHWAHMAEAGWPPENALAASEDPGHYPFMATDITPSKATFIRRHDPARVLREVEAGRKLLGLLEQARASSFPPAVVRLIEDIVQDRAAVYSDHPDYDEAWKP